MTSKLAAALNGGDSDDDYAEEFEADAPMINKGVKSLLAQAAAQVQEENRLESRNSLNEIDKNVLEVQTKPIKVVNSDPKDAFSAKADESDDDGNEYEGDDQLSVALRIACWHGDTSKVSSLLDKGANPRKKDRHGWTSLHFACKSGASDCVELLIEFAKKQSFNFRAFLNATESLNRWTGLHIACINSHKDVVKLLINFGAAKDKIDNAGDTPVECIPAAARNAKQLRKLFGIMELDPTTQSEGKESGDYFKGDAKDGGKSFEEKM